MASRYITQLHASAHNGVSASRIQPGGARFICVLSLNFAYYFEGRMHI